MDDIDRIIERVRRADSATEPVRPGDHTLRSVLPVVDSLRHRGLSYAMDRYRPEVLAGAAETARHFGCPELDGVLGGAAQIAQTCHGRRLSSAIDTYDRRHTVHSLDTALRAAVAGWLQREPDAFQPPLPGTTPLPERPPELCHPWSTGIV
jgi:hypothetical protein